ncbi:hypothetical protein [Photorhabdus bodei]|uniref:hypothetical protein n=1 Tax=Photorhabdus bodei TaxID=2029681 RepID=UPI001E632E88|nr:hypothetical protein [Photorhabdus bodei]MCC8463864.1 hypothetical protein [Photorhabdus bodei]
MSQNKKHVHAELMMQYAQDALRTDEPWKLWECENKKGEGFSTLMYHPNWFEGVIYRRKLEIITVGKVSFPKPIDYELKEGQIYWVVDNRGTCYRQQWDDNPSDIELLKSRQLHLTEEAAEQHAQAIAKINNGEF